MVETILTLLTGDLAKTVLAGLAAVVAALGWGWKKKREGRVEAFEEVEEKLERQDADTRKRMHDALAGSRDADAARKRLQRRQR